MNSRSRSTAAARSQRARRIRCSYADAIPFVINNRIALLIKGKAASQHDPLLDLDEFLRAEAPRDRPDGPIDVEQTEIIKERRPTEPFLSCALWCLYNSCLRRFDVTVDAPSPLGPKSG